MKKILRIIEGKRYNTETAEMLAEWGNNLGMSDFRHVEEALYRTKKGIYFLAGYGGALSAYAQPSGNSGRCDGEGLQPMTAAEAVAWLESHNLTDEIEEYFPESIEDA